MSKSGLIETLLSVGISETTISESLSGVSAQAPSVSEWSGSLSAGYRLILESIGAVESSGQAITENLALISAASQALAESEIGVMGSAQGLAEWLSGVSTMAGTLVENTGYLDSSALSLIESVLRVNIASSALNENLVQAGAGASALLENIAHIQIGGQMQMEALTSVSVSSGAMVENLLAMFGGESGLVEYQERIAIGKAVLTEWSGAFTSVDVQRQALVEWVSNVAVLNLAVVEHSLLMSSQAGAITESLQGVKSLSETVPLGKLVKTSGAATFDAGAASNETMPADGAVEFTATSLSGDTIVGMGYGNTSVAAGDVDFGWWLRTDGTAIVIENGATQGVSTPWAKGDVFGVVRSGTGVGAISYTKNGATHSTTIKTVSAGAVLIDTSMGLVGGEIAGAKLGGSFVTWGNQVNVTPSDWTRSLPGVSAENLGTLAKSAAAVYENVVDVTATSRALMESSGVVDVSIGAVAEFGSRVASMQQALVENMELMSSSGQAAAEFMAGVSPNLPSLIEYRGAVTAIHRALIEHTIEVADSKASILEALTGVSGSSPAAAEWAAGLEATAQFLSEHIGAFDITHAALTENLTLMSSSRKAAIEHLISTGASGTAAFEFTSILATLKALITEWKSLETLISVIDANEPGMVMVTMVRDIIESDQSRYGITNTTPERDIRKVR